MLHENTNDWAVLMYIQKVSWIVPRELLFAIMLMTIYETQKIKMVEDSEGKSSSVAMLSVARMPCFVKLVGSD